MKSKMLAVHTAIIALALSTGIANGQEKTTARKSAKSTQANAQGYTCLNVDYDSTDSSQHITTYKDGAVYKFKVVNDKISEIFIDGKKMPEQDFPRYESMIKKILEQVKQDREQADRDREQADKDRAQAELDRQQADKDREQADQDKVQAGIDRAQAELDRQQAVKDREQADKDKVQAGIDRKHAELYRQQATKDRAQADKDKVQAGIDRKHAELYRQQATKDRAQADKDKVQAGIDRKHAELDRQQAMKDRAQAEIDRKKAEEDRKLLAALITDLVNEKVIESKDALYSLELSNKTLIVNDKKQPVELYEKMKAKYLKKAGTRISFSKTGNIRGFNIQQDK